MTKRSPLAALQPDRLKIGVLALQGSFQEHLAVLEKIGTETVEIRLSEQLQDIDGLIIPGGESTTIGKLLVDFKLLEPLRKYGKKKAIWGTCAGAILLSKDAQRTQQVPRYFYPGATD
jgi:5'-phosphate synthase pdxT subunit